MTFNIEDFKSNTNKGFLKPSNFLMYVHWPRWAVQSNYGADLAYLTSTTSLPGVQILTSESRIYGQGPVVKMPYDIATTDMTATFYADGAGKSLQYFYDWIRNVVNLNHNPAEVNRDGASSNEISYRRDYATNIDIMVFGDTLPGGQKGQDGAIMIFTLHDAYPISVSESNLSWETSNEIIKFNVTFTYRSFEIKAFEPQKAITTSRPIPVPPPVDIDPNNPRQIPPPGTIDASSPRTGVGPRSLTTLPAQVGLTGSSGSAALTSLRSVNQFAQNIKQGSMGIRNQSVSAVGALEQQIFNNEFVQTALTAINSINDVKKTLGTISQLNNSLKGSLLTDIKGAINGALPRL